MRAQRSGEGGGLLPSAEARLDRDSVRNHVSSRAARLDVEVAVDAPVERLELLGLPEEVRRVEDIRVEVDRISLEEDPAR